MKGSNKLKFYLVINLNLFCYMFHVKQEQTVRNSSSTSTDVIKNTLQNLLLLFIVKFGNLSDFLTLHDKHNICTLPLQYNMLVSIYQSNICQYLLMCVSIIPVLHRYMITLLEGAVLFYLVYGFLCH